jgi:Cyclin, N-terminal domain
LFASLLLGISKSAGSLSAHSDRTLEGELRSAATTATVALSLAMSGPRTSDLITPAKTTEEDAWLFTDEELAETPSRVAGISAADEDRVHAASTRFILDCATELNLPQITGLVAATFARRFFMLESITDHSPALVASACLFLACKVQETHKRLREFVSATVKVRTSCSARGIEGEDIHDDSPLFEGEKLAMLAKEADVLRILNFEMAVGQPHKHLLVLNKLFLNAYQRETKDVVAARLRVKSKEAGQYAWNLINDSIGSYLHVRYDAREIATTAIFLAAAAFELTLEPLANGAPWHSYFKCSLDHIDEIGNAMLNNFDLAAQQNGHRVKEERL